MTHVAISYRDDGHGKGAFYDHFTLRKMTDWSTRITASKDLPTTEFASYINKRQADEVYGLPGEIDLPCTSHDYAKNAAFIFIPGYTKDADNKQTAAHKARLDFEKALIRKAIYRGQPIIAVCAGSWTLWESLGGKIKSVSDHNYGGAMPRLSKSEAKICNNKMIHDIITTPNTLLNDAMLERKDARFVGPVNSVHWNAVDESLLHNNSNICISARSLHNDLIAPNSRQSNKMQPEECVEAFENIFGAPMIGIQWHLEAFNPGETNAAPHQKIFNALKTAGMTYQNKQELNKEFMASRHAVRP